MLHKPAQIDTTLKDRLAAEAPGILRWMIDGFLAYQKDGLKPTAAIGAASAAYVGEQDIPKMVTKDWIEFRPQGRVLNRDLNTAVMVYLRMNGMQRKLPGGRLQKYLLANYPSLVRDGYHARAKAIEGCNLTPEAWDEIAKFRRQNGDPLPEIDEKTGGYAARAKMWTMGDDE
jgi:putative DNA primase/helicase